MLACDVRGEKLSTGCSTHSRTKFWGLPNPVPKEPRPRMATAGSPEAPECPHRVTGSPAAAQPSLNLLTIQVKLAATVRQPFQHMPPNQAQSRWAESHLEWDQSLCIYQIPESMHIAEKFLKEIPLPNHGYLGFRIKV